MPHWGKMMLVGIFVTEFLEVLDRGGDAPRTRGFIDRGEYNNDSTFSCGEGRLDVERFKWQVHGLHRDV